MSSPSDDFTVVVGVEALVCGAISNRSLSEALHMGLLVWSGVAGRAEKVGASLASTGDLSEEFSMPRVPAPRYCRDLAWTGGEGPLIWGWRVGADRLAMMSQVG